jgi:hypothetical protein
LTLYLDSSALVKRYVTEEGSDEVRAAMREAQTWSSCRLGFVETVRAVSLKVGEAGARRARRDWMLAERAVTLAVEHRLRALDAIHLAAALDFPGEGQTFATWDTRLHRAARAHGLRTLPAALS